VRLTKQRQGLFGATMRDEAGFPALFRDFKSANTLITGQILVILRLF
jgi:hypothetical protein